MWSEPGATCFYIKDEIDAQNNCGIEWDVPITSCVLIVLTKQREIIVLTRWYWIILRLHARACNPQ